jgi:hypothetical protein
VMVAFESRRFAIHTLPKPPVPIMRTGAYCSLHCVGHKGEGGGDDEATMTESLIQWPSNACGARTLRLPPLIVAYIIHTILTSKIFKFQFLWPKRFWLFRWTYLLITHIILCN